MGIFRVHIGGQWAILCYNTRMNDSIQCEEFYDDRQEQWIIELNESRDQETISK
jgi:hypothetical protein